MSAFDKFPVFIDVGASDGRIWRSWFRLVPDAHIYAFEPQPKNFEVMKEYQTAKSNVKMYQTAISTSNSTSGVSFYISNDRNSSSLYPYNKDNIRKWKYPPGRRLFKTTETIKVPTMRLDTLIKKERLRYVDFVKVDTQGHDEKSWICNNNTRK